MSDSMFAGERVWYVAYGSNISHTRFARYLETDPRDSRIASADDRTMVLDRAVYFAGASETWNGPVAFLSLVRSESASSVGYARLLDIEDVARIAKRENGDVGAEGILSVREPEVGEWAPLITQRSETKGKYNALLRLSDIDGRPAVTVTTSRLLPLGMPTAPYRGLIEESIGTRLHVDDVVRGENNRKYLPDEYSFRIGASQGFFAGLPLLTVPASYAPISDGQLLTGRIITGGRSFSAWVRFSERIASGDCCELDSGLAASLGIGAHDTAEMEVRFSTPTRLGRQPGRIDDLGDTDVLQVRPSDANALGPWALLTNARLAAPVRVVARSHVPAGQARIAYALRTLGSIEAETEVELQPLRPVSRRSSLRVLRKLGEIVLGAPPLALRSTEGLVGDDGRRILRVDESVLDLVGVSSGDVVIVTWADRQVSARVLLQTELTRARMASQLREETGKQSRESLGDVTSRMQTPPHLQAWLSSTLRHELSIPADSIVRVRRSLAQTLTKNAALLALPAGGLAIGALAIPDVSTWALLALPLVLVTSVLPIRMRTRERASVRRRG